MMHIVFSTDDGYAVGCGVCICSIVRHNDPKECYFHIFTSSLNAENRAKFAEIGSTYGCKIDIVDVDKTMFDSVGINGRFTVYTYYRFLAPQLLDCDKSLYFDCDILVRGSIKELWETDITDAPLAAVEDQAYSQDPKQFIEHIGPYNHTYFNAGVILLNHAYWREHNLLPQLIKAAQEHPSFTFYDQDALNFLLRDKAKLMSHRFNYQLGWTMGKGAESLKDNPYHVPEEEAVVIHYCSSAPWVYGEYHPLSHLFFEELEQSPWRGYDMTMTNWLITLTKPLKLVDKIFNTDKGYKLTSLIVYKWFKHRTKR